MKKLIFIFLDGVGIGAASQGNPFYAAKSEFLPFYKGNPGLPDSTPIKPIDALLGVEGIPQSASGQASLYSGENVPKLLNQHRGSYPNRLMREIISKKNILLNLKEKGRSAVFINAYPVYSRLFTVDHIRIGPGGEFHFSRAFPAEFKRRISVTTCMMVTAQQAPFNERTYHTTLAYCSVFFETNRIRNNIKPKKQFALTHQLSHFLLFYVNDKGHSK